MTNVWCVRAEFGEHTDEFVAGGYAGMGWIRKEDLSNVKDKEELRRLYKEAYPQDADPRVNTNVGQIYRFIVAMKPGDYVLTPTINGALLRYGRLTYDPYYESQLTDGCPFPHRRKVQWAQLPLNRGDLSADFQKTLKYCQLTVFGIKHREEFLGIFILPERT